MYHKKGDFIMEVILNKSYGGFHVSEEGYDLYCKKMGVPICRYGHDYSKFSFIKLHSREEVERAFVVYHYTKDFGESFSSEDSFSYNPYYIILNENYRFNPTLIEVVKELGSKASTQYSNLQVIEVPGDNPDDYIVDEYDGFETMHLKVPIY